jgi:hypothetical protein
VPCILFQPRIETRALVGIELPLGLNPQPSKGLVIDR